MINIPTGRYINFMRKKSSNPLSRQKLVATATRLMTSKGFAATSVEEICECSGLTKGSFFHYFGSKEEVGQAALQSYCTVLFDRFDHIAHTSDPLGRVFGYIDACIELARQSPPEAAGCLLGALSQEVSETHPSLRNECGRYFKEWVGRLKADLDEAVKRPGVSPTLNTTSLAKHFIAVLEGSLILAKAQRDMSVVQDGMSHFRAYVAQLFQYKP